MLSFFEQCFQFGMWDYSCYIQLWSGAKIWEWTLQEGSVKIIIDVVVVMEVKNSEHWKRTLKEKILEKLIFFVLCTSIGYSELDYEVPMHGIEGLINKYENIYL